MNFMEIAILEARKAELIGEIPVGAVIIKNNEIISTAFNKRECLNSPTAHAEILAIEKAAKKLGNWRLNGCEMYVTLEPCPMCAGAILQSRLSKLHIGTFDQTSGACGSVINLMDNPNLNRFVHVKWEYNEECSHILEEFFKRKRAKI